MQSRLAGGTDELMKQFRKWSAKAASHSDGTGDNGLSSATALLVCFSSTPVIHRRPDEGGYRSGRGLYDSRNAVDRAAPGYGGDKS